MGRAVWPAEPFLKKCPNIKKRPLFPKYTCPFFQEQVPKMSFSPMSHRQPLAMGSSRGGAPRKCRGVWGGRSPPQDDILTTYLHSISRYRGSQNGWSFSISRKAGYIRMVGPSVFPEKQVIPKWLVLQYFQIHQLYQNDWSFSISRHTSYTKMAGPSVFPDTQVIPKWLDFQYFQIHRFLKWSNFQYFQTYRSLK